MLTCLALENQPDSLDRSMENATTMSEYLVHSERFLAQAGRNRQWGTCNRLPRKAGAPSPKC